MRRRARAARLYTLFLRQYPRAHRQRFGEQMLQTFRDHYHDAAEVRVGSRKRATGYSKVQKGGAGGQ